MSKQAILASKSSPVEVTSDPAVVYDRVTRAWQLMLGDDLHFGYFETPDAPLGTATERLTKEMAGWAGLRSAIRVLDVGCGIGGPALFLAQELGCQVTGISTSQIGVRLAAIRTAKRLLSDRVEFLERDGMASGLSAESYDCVWILESSHLMARKDLLLAESSRVLRPDGLLVLCDIVVRNPIPFVYLARHLSEFENLNAVFGKQHVEPLTVYAEMARGSGLTVLRTEDISEAVFPTLERWRHNAELHRNEVRELAGDEYLARFIRACQFLERLWQEGKLGYGMISAQKRLGQR